MFLTMFLNLSFKVNHTKHRLGLVVHNQFDSFVKVSTTCSFDLKNLELNSTIFLSLPNIMELDAYIFAFTIKHQIFINVIANSLLNKIFCRIFFLHLLSR